MHYRSPVRLPEGADPAAIFEELFERNGWRDSWRNGIYDYAHYHSRTHEVLGVARGHARVRFGGNKGRVFTLRAGDVAILPTRTGHQCRSASKDLLVVGAYPPSGKYDECTGSPIEHRHAVPSIRKVPLPKKDPVYGADGPLILYGRCESINSVLWPLRSACSIFKSQSTARRISSRDRQVALDQLHVRSVCVLWMKLPGTGPWGHNEPISATLRSRCEAIAFARAG